MDSIDNIRGRMEDYDEGSQGRFMAIYRPVFTFMAGFATALVFMVLVS